MIATSTDPGPVGIGPEGTVLGTLLWVAIIALYWAPAFIAWRRKHRQLAPILVLNFLGCLAITWVIALVWSLTSDVQVTEPAREENRR